MLDFGWLEFHLMGASTMNARANGKAARRLETFKRLLAHLHEVASLDFGFVLWDDSTVPADLPSNALAIAFADVGVVAALLRRPNADTFLNLWVTARIDIRHGDISISGAPAQTAEQRRSADVLKSVGAGDGTQISVRAAGGPWPLRTFAATKRVRTGAKQSTRKTSIITR
jgi:cyclopropane-fatty-acyl-phospholipid synthase